MLLPIFGYVAMRSSAACPASSRRSPQPGRSRSMYCAASERSSSASGCRSTRSTQLCSHSLMDFLGRNRLHEPRFHFVEPPLRYSNPFLLDRALLVRAQAVEQVFGERAPLLDRQRHRILEDLFVAPAHRRKAYRASTASRSFSAWKCEISGSMITSRLPFMTSGRLCTVRPMRWSVTRSCGKLYVRIFSERSPLPIMPLRVADSSASRFWRSMSWRRAFSAFNAFARFLICDFSSWHDTTTPVGRWVMRTAEYVVFTDWPPGPEEQNVSMRRSFSALWMSMSSASGSTATVIADVGMRPCVSVCGTRCTRCTPDSNLRRE